MTKPNIISPAGLAVIKKYEGLGPEWNKSRRIIAYLCPSGIPTIGWGHTGSDVQPRDVGVKEITLGEADKLLMQDLKRFQTAVSNAVKVGLTQGQFDALVSFCYNAGESAFRESTLLQLLNTGDYRAVPVQLKQWVYGNARDPKTGRKKVLPGLVTRRNEEIELWRSA